MSSTVSIRIAEAAAGKPGANSRVLRLLCIGLLTGFVLSFAVAYAEYRMGFSRFHYNPLTGDRYQDLMEFQPVFRLLHTGAFFEGIGDSRLAYPPFCAVIYAVIYATGHPVLFYLAGAALWLCASVWGLSAALRKQGIGMADSIIFPILVALTSFPIAGLIQRGNIELYVWIFAASGTWFFFRGRSSWAALFWGLAAAMKLYPVILLGLLLPRRSWRAIGVGVVTFTGVTIISMVWLGPSISIAWHGAVRNVFGYQGHRAAEWTLHELMANHTAYHLAKFGAAVLHMRNSNLTLWYYGVSAAILAAAFFGKLWRMPVANQLLAFTAFMLALPPVSYFYTLVHLYASWLVLLFVSLRAEQMRVRIRGLHGTLMLFLPLFATFMLFTFPRVYLFGGLVHGFLLVILFLCALQYRFELPGNPPHVLNS